MIAKTTIASVAIPPIGVSRGIPLQQVAGCVADEVASAARGKTWNAPTCTPCGLNQKENDAFDRTLKLTALQTSALDAAKNSQLH